MGGADGVHAQGAQRGQAALPDRGGHGDSHSATVGMEGDALNLEVAAIEPETGIRSEVKFADAEGDLLIVCRGVVVGEDADLRSIKGGVINIPSFRCWDRKLYNKI